MKRQRAPECCFCGRREGEATVVAEPRARVFGEPKPAHWFWLDEKPHERFRRRGQKGALAPLWRDNSGAGAWFTEPAGPRQRQLVVLYQARGGQWEGELICELCLADLDKWEREGATFTRRELPAPAPAEVGQLSLPEVAA